MKKVSFELAVFSTIKIIEEEKGKEGMVYSSFLLSLSFNFSINALILVFTPIILALKVLEQQHLCFTKAYIYV